jgi:hypothetical protein
MSKRLQVVLHDMEYDEIQQAARARHMTLAEWVRQALDLARRREPATEAGKKLAAIRAAARCHFPSGDITAMLAEIDKGYSSGGEP